MGAMVDLHIDAMDAIKDKNGDKEDVDRERSRAIDVSKILKHLLGLCMKIKLFFFLYFYLQLCQLLANEYDPIRKEYWDFMTKDIAHKFS